MLLAAPLQRRLGSMRVGLPHLAFQSNCRRGYACCSFSSSSCELIANAASQGPACDLVQSQPSPSALLQQAYKQGLARAIWWSKSVAIVMEAACTAVAQRQSQPKDASLLQMSYWRSTHPQVLNSRQSWSYWGPRCSQTDTSAAPTQRMGGLAFADTLNMVILTFLVRVPTMFC